jgi:hypothetical protein
MSKLYPMRSSYNIARTYSETASSLEPVKKQTKLDKSPPYWFITVWNKHKFKILVISSILFLIIFSFFNILWWPEQEKGTYSLEYFYNNERHVFAADVLKQKYDNVSFDEGVNNYHSNNNTVDTNDNIENTEENIYENTHENSEENSHNNIYNINDNDNDDDIKIEFLTQRMSRSPYPRDSKGELKCREIMEKLFEKPFPKQRPKFLLNEVTGRHLEIDCFNEDLMLGVEYSGKQHDEFTAMHKNKEAFMNQKYRDIMKKRLCKENNVDLIVVPYTVKIENIEDFLIKELEQCGYVVE